MHFELRTAWSELRASWKRFVFATSAVAIGVAALSGVKGFSEALQSSLLRQSRELIAADFTVRTGTFPTVEETDALAELERRGAERTEITETVSMSAGQGDTRPILVSVKAVDPNRYPFYGDLVFDPPIPVGEALGPGSVSVSEDFLQRLSLRVGDEIQLGMTTFRIAAVLRWEPDRLASGMEFGPRVLLSHDSLERAALVQRGSRVTRVHLFRVVTPNYDLDAAQEFVRGITAVRLRMVDYRRPNPQLNRGLERMSTFLSLVSLISLLMGGLGVAMAMHAYLQQKLDGIAIMKMLGGRSQQILRIYLYQALMIGMAGCLVGVALGYGVQVLFPGFIGGLLDIPVELELAPLAAIQGFAVGIVACLLLTLPPLLAIRRIRPSQVLRRNMNEEAVFHLRRLPPGMGWTAISVLFLVGALGGIATWLGGGSWERGFGFLGALAAAVIVLLVCAKLLTRSVPRFPKAHSLAWRHGLANLGRPGSQSAPVFVALGVGVMFTAAVYLMQSSLLDQLVQAAPEDFPNLVLIGIPEKDREPLWELLSREEGMIDSGVPVANLPGRIRAVNGVPLEAYQEEISRTDDDASEQDPQDSGRRRRRFGRGEYQLTWAEQLPPDAEILEGQWWNGRPPEDEVSVAEYFARNLDIGPGDTLEFNSAGRIFSARVSSIRGVLFMRPGSNNAFIFSPGTLDGLPVSYVGNLRVQPEAIANLQRKLFEKFPTITSIHVGEILVTVQQLLDRISMIIQFVAAFAILAGCIILASAVAATRQRRIKESVILKTLGATRALVSRIQSVEFLVLGFTAGAVGSLSANALASYLLGNLLDTEYAFRWSSILVGSASTAVLAVVTGRLAGRGILNHKPMEVLREE